MPSLNCENVIFFSIFYRDILITKGLKKGHSQWGLLNKDLDCRDSQSLTHMFVQYVCTCAMNV